MTKWQWDASHDDDPLEEPPDDSINDDLPVQRKDRGKMPVSSESKAKAASKATWRSKRATKRISRTGGGIRNRRRRKIL